MDQQCRLGSPPLRRRADGARGARSPTRAGGGRAATSAVAAEPGQQVELAPKLVVLESRVLRPTP